VPAAIAATFAQRLKGGLSDESLDDEGLRMDGVYAVLKQGSGSLQYHRPMRLLL